MNQKGVNPPSVRRARVRMIATLCLCAGLGMQYAAGQQDHKSWRDYGGGPDNSKFVDLNQITKANVGQLTVAWQYSTNDNSSYLFNPIITATSCTFWRGTVPLWRSMLPAARSCGFTRTCREFHARHQLLGER